jgi:hypothetical protein
MEEEEEEWEVTAAQATLTTTSAAVEAVVLEATEAVVPVAAAEAGAVERSPTEAMRMARRALEAQEVSPAVAMEVMVATREMMGGPLRVRAAAVVVVAKP